MHTINVFEDKDGDYVVTDADKVAPGINAWQLNGERVRKTGGPIKSLEALPIITLAIQAGTLEADTADLIASLQHKLVESVESEKLAKVLRTSL